MKDNKATTDFIVTTTSGTRWGTTAASFAQVRLEFFGKHFGSGMEIANIERGRLFTPEEAELKREENKENEEEEMSEAEKRVDTLINGRTTFFKELIARHGKSPTEKEEFWTELEKVLLKHQHLLPESREEERLEN